MSPVAELDGQYVLRSYEDGRRVKLRTGCFDLHSAELFRAAYVAEREGWLRPAPAREVRLRTVIDATAAAGGVSPPVARRLHSFFGELRLDEVDRAACMAYAEDRAEDRDDANWAPDGSPSATTIHLKLAALRAALNDYCEAHGLPAPVVYLTRQGPGRTAWLRKAEVDRLLRVADGRVWDAAAGAFASCPRTGAPLRHPQEIVARWRPMRMLLRVTLWTCSRVSVIRELRWSRSPDAPYVDLARGLLHRRGYRQPQTSKRTPTVPLSPKLLRLMRRWAAEDRRLGRAHVVTTDRGRYLGIRSYWSLMAEIVAAAGLPEDVTMHVLRHSGAVWMLEAGIEPADVAAFMGVTVRILLDWYDHYDWSFSRSAADALDAATS